MWSRTAWVGSVLPARMPSGVQDRTDSVVRAHMGSMVRDHMDNVVLDRVVNDRMPSVVRAEWTVTAWLCRH